MMMNKEYIFESERLRFRYWEMEDKDFYVSLCQNPEVMKFFPKILSPQEAIGEMFYLDDQLRDNGFGFWAVESKDTSLLIGDIGIQRVNFPSFFTPAIEIGWRLMPDFWGQGYATESAKRIFDFAKENSICDEIVSFTAEINTPSQKVMQRLGMEFVDSFDHPNVDSDSPLCRHVLYKITI